MTRAVRVVVRRDKILAVAVSIEGRQYSCMAIYSFKCRETESLFHEVRVKRFVNIEAIALRKLAMLNRAAVLGDLQIPPDNKLEPLLGDRRGQYSIRINQQGRLCFVWSVSGPSQVEIVDYH